MFWNNIHRVGCWLSVALLSHKGRRNIQLQFLILGIASPQWNLGFPLPCSALRCMNTHHFQFSFLVFTFLHVNLYMFNISASTAATKGLTTQAPISSLYKKTSFRQNKKDKNQQLLKHPKSQQGNHKSMKLFMLDPNVYEFVYFLFSIYNNYGVYRCTSSYAYSYFMHIQQYNM